MFKVLLVVGEFTHGVVDTGGYKSELVWCWSGK